MDGMTIARMNLSAQFISQHTPGGMLATQATMQFSFRSFLSWLFLLRRLRTAFWANQFAVKFCTDVGGQLFR